MLHPSYSDLMKVVNSEVEDCKQPLFHRNGNSKKSKTDHRRT